MRGGGTSQAGQAIGEGLQVDHLEILQPDPGIERRGALGSRPARYRPRRTERVVEAARPALRARHFDREPRDHRRHDGEQLQRRAIRALRQNHRPRARADGVLSDGSVVEFRELTHRRTGRQSCRETPSRPNAIGPCIVGARDAPTKWSAASRKCCVASVATTSMSFTGSEAIQPGETDRRLGRYVRRRAGSEAEPGPTAEMRKPCWSSSFRKRSKRWPRPR